MLDVVGRSVGDWADFWSCHHRGAVARNTQRWERGVVREVLQTVSAVQSRMMELVPACSVGVSKALIPVGKPARNSTLFRSGFWEVTR
jgi:hypothetical protein